MSNDQTQPVFEQLFDEQPRVRIKAIRRLAAIGEISSIPELNGILSSEDEVPEVKQAAREALGVFRAVQIAIEKNQDVVLPDPAEVKEPRFSPEFLRLMLSILSVVFILLVAIDLAIVALPGTASDTADLSPETALQQMILRVSQLEEDVAIQKQSWQQYRAISTLGCDSYPQPANTSVNTGDLNNLEINAAEQPELHQANALLITAITQFTVVNNDRILGCSTGQPGNTPDQNLTALEAVGQQLAQISVLLDQVSVAVATPTVGELSTEEATSSVIPTATLAEGQTLEQPTPTELAFDYAPFIRGMRDKIDFVKGGRGAATLLSQYWQDVIDTGQSFGCRQLLSQDGLENYVAVTADIAAMDPRLNDVQVALNVGLTLLRSSVEHFHQGCNAGTFVSVVNLGYQEIQQAIVALNQASAMLDSLQAEIQNR